MKRPVYWRLGKTAYVTYFPMKLTTLMLVETLAREVPPKLARQTRGTLDKDSESERVRLVMVPYEAEDTVERPSYHTIGQLC